MCFPHEVPGAAGRSNVVHESLTKHHNLEQISSSWVQTVASVVPNCKLHCRSASYVTPAGTSRYSL